LDAIAIMNDTIVTTRGEAILEGRAEGMELGLAEGIERGLAKGLEKGRVEGRAEGRAEGERKKAFDIAKKMLQCNIAIETIRETTGLTKEEISGIQ
ncbi:MAG: transposase, partial [Marinilabiliaceae bacterium]|nr:transposase [Marinilabiliaceae bacterium]